MHYQLSFYFWVGFFFSAFLLFQFIILLGMLVQKKKSWQVSIFFLLETFGDRIALHWQTPPQCCKLSCDPFPALLSGLLVSSCPSQHSFCPAFSTFSSVTVTALFFFLLVLTWLNTLQPLSACWASFDQEHLSGHSLHTSFACLCLITIL